MDEFEKGEFWQALGRLYDSALALQQATEGLHKTATAHDERIVRLEVLVQWLADEQRKRESGA